MFELTGFTFISLMAKSTLLNSTKEFQLQAVRMQENEPEEQFARAETTPGCAQAPSSPVTLTLTQPFFPHSFLPAGAGTKASSTLGSGSPPERLPQPRRTLS